MVHHSLPLINFRPLDVLPGRIHHRLPFFIGELNNPFEKVYSFLFDSHVPPFATCGSFHCNATPFFRLASYMTIFLVESYNKQKYLCIQLGNKDVKDTKVQIRKPTAHFSKSKHHEGPPSLPYWLKKNLKTKEMFLSSSHHAA